MFFTNPIFEIMLPVILYIVEAWKCNVSTHHWKQWF